MHLVLLWRDTIPDDWDPIAPGKDRRIACEFPVTFGDPEATQSLSEQSVLVRGHAAVVVDNLLQDESIFEGLPAIIRNALSALEGGNPEQAPFGIERIDWDPVARVCHSVWANDAISIPNGIPAMSQATGLVYGIGQREGVWGLEGVDFETGGSRLFVPAGTSACSAEALDLVNPLLLLFIGPTLERLPASCENSLYAGTEVGPDGAIVTGTFQGISKYAPASPVAVSALVRAGAGIRQGIDLADRALAALAPHPARALDAIERGVTQLGATLEAFDEAFAAREGRGPRTRLRWQLTRRARVELQLARAALERWDAADAATRRLEAARRHLGRADALEQGRP
jgi:hypothetical protein